VAKFKSPLGSRLGRDLDVRRKHRNFHLVPGLSHAKPEYAWTGRNGPVHKAMLADFADLSGREV
jgi:Na+-transporting NADH:ubiquinone oxidoreductase subunit NqrF